jgi:hypothetical protein
MVLVCVVVTFEVHHVLGMDIPKTVPTHGPHWHPTPQSNQTAHRATQPLHDLVMMKSSKLSYLGGFLSSEG